MSNLIKFYQSILSLGSLSADSDGLVSCKVGDLTMPFTVKDARLALPTRENLKSPGDKVIFHPARENTLRATESEVMQRYRGAINTRLNYVVGCLVGELLTVVSSVDEHRKLTPDQSRLLSEVASADEDTLIRFGKIVQASKKSTDASKAFVNIYLKKLAVIDGKNYKRGAIVSFPFFEELVKKPKNMHGVTLRNRDVEAYINLFKFIFPGIEQPGSYNQGSNSDLCPYLHALLLGVMKVGEPINSVVEEYRAFLALSDEYVFNDDWVDTAQNIHVLLPDINMIPSQAGNEGSHAPATSSTNLTISPMPQSTAAQPLTTPVNAPSSNGTQSWADLSRAIYGNNPQPFAPQPQVGWGFQQPQMTGPQAARASISALSILASNQPQPQPQANGFGNGFGNPSFNGQFI